MFVASRESVSGATSDWWSAPKPKFPQSALKNGSEGSVSLRILIKEDGSVAAAKVLKSSGDPDLDVTAQKTVLKWRLNPRSIKPADLTTGRDEIVDFRQEAALAAIHPDRVGMFQDNSGRISETKFYKRWMFAPFPSYPFEARARHEEGRVLLSLTIGKNGKPEGVRIVQSSGHAILDQCAIRAVALWKAHKQYVGEKVVFPITFKVARRFR
jgi:TonB family protein